MEGAGDIEQQLLQGHLKAAYLATTCVLLDGQMIYEDGEPKGKGVPERHSIEYNQFVDIEPLIDLFDAAPLATKKRILKTVAVFVTEEPGQVSGFLHHLPYCLMLRSASLEFESQALRVIEDYVDHLQERGEDLPEELRQTIPVLVARLDNSSSVPDHEKYGRPLIHIERVAPGALAPYLDVFVHPSHNRGERHIHVPSLGPDSIEANPDCVDTAFRRTVSRIVDRRQWSYDEEGLADDVVALKRLLGSVSRSEKGGVVVSEEMMGLVRSTVLSVRDTTGSGGVRKAVGEALDLLDAVEADETPP